MKIVNATTGKRKGIMIYIGDEEIGYWTGFSYENAEKETSLEFCVIENAELEAEKINQICQENAWNMWAKVVED